MIRCKEVNFVFKINEIFFLQNIQKERRLLQKMFAPLAKSEINFHKIL